MNSPQPQNNGKENASMLDYLKTWPLFLLPQHFLSSLMHRFMRIQHPGFKNLQISLFSKLFKVNMNEAVQQDSNGFADFNQFFTRELKPECRVNNTNNHELCCPVDGAISELGDINDDQLFQAKGHYFSLNDLLAGDQTLADTFRNGKFATIYLSPKDYHRIHMPLDGSLKQMLHVPGQLFGVNNASVKAIPRLFARNERVISIFETPAGTMALILVGAIFVSSIETTWHGVVTPPRSKQVQRWHYKDPVTINKAQEMGRFNMGSTVILLFPENTIDWDNNLHANLPVQLGQLLGEIKPEHK